MYNVHESHVHITVENEVMIKEYLEATLYRRYEDSNNGRFMQKYGVFFQFPIYFYLNNTFIYILKGIREQAQSILPFSVYQGQNEYIINTLKYSIYYYGWYYFDFCFLIPSYKKEIFFEICFIKKK